MKTAHFVSLQELKRLRTAPVQTRSRVSTSFIQQTERTSECAPPVSFPTTTACSVEVTLVPECLFSAAQDFACLDRVGVGDNRANGLEELEQRLQPWRRVVSQARHRRATLAHSCEG